MTTTRSLCLSLELSSDGERIAGRLEDQHGNDWPFTSRLGLLTLIDRLGTSASSSSRQPAELPRRNKEVS